MESAGARREIRLRLRRVRHVFGVLRAAILTLAIAGFARPAAAQEQSLTLADALHEAHEAAPTVLVSAARAAVADRDVEVAGILPDPTLGVGASVSYNLIATFFVSLPVFGQLGAAVGAAEAQARVARAGIEVARLDAALAVRTAWTQLWLAQQRVQLAAEDVARRERLADAATGRFDEGAGTRLDVLRAQADVSRARGEQSALTSLRDAAAARLAGLLGREAGQSIVPSGDPELGGRAPALSSVSRLVANHPLASRSGATVAAADAVVEQAHRTRWPNLGLSVQDWWGRSNNIHDVRVILSMQVPIFDEPRISRAETARSAAQSAHEAVGIDLRAALVAARAEYIAAVQRAAAQEEEVLPASREAAELSDEAYRSGGLDLDGRARGGAGLLGGAGGRDSAARAQRALAYARMQHAAGEAL